MLNRGAVALRWMRDGHWRDVAFSAVVTVVNFSFFGYDVTNRLWFNAAFAFCGGSVVGGTLVFTTLMRSHVWWGKEQKRRRQEFQANLDAMWLESLPHGWRIVLQPTEFTGEWIVVKPLPKQIPADAQAAMNKMLELLAPSIRR